MKQTRIRLFGSVLMIIIIPMALYLLGIWKNSDSHLTTQVLTSGIAVLVIVGFSMAVWIYSGIIRPLEKLHEAMNEIKEGNLDKVLDAEDVGGEIRQLMEDFEEMRIRLKENQEEKLQYDRDNKELISNITHDLKTPITSIKGYVEGILDGVARSPEQMNRYIRTIYNKANDMDRLINELTLYSRMESDRIPYNFQKINVGDYFGDCAYEIGMDMEQRGIQLNYMNMVDPATCIIADPEQLKRVVNNIIGNSVKYIDKPHGIIDIRILDEQDSIRLEIEDNGKGIAARDLPNIFERFYRTDSSRSSAQGGSGIGLSIVKKIVEDHGGFIWATSREGEGTCMHIVIRKYIEREDFGVEEEPQAEPEKKTRGFGSRKSAAGRG